MTEPRSVLLEIHFDVSWREISEATGELVDVAGVFEFGDDEATARRCHAEMIAGGPRLWPRAHLMRDIVVGDLVQVRKYRAVHRSSGRSHWREDPEGTVKLAAGDQVVPPDAVQPSLDQQAAS